MMMTSHSEQIDIFGNAIDTKEIYEEDKKINKDHVATPRYVVEDIYSLIDIKSFKRRRSCCYIKCYRMYGSF